MNWETEVDSDSPSFSLYFDLSPAMNVMPHEEDQALWGGNSSEDLLGVSERFSSPQTQNYPHDTAEPFGEEEWTKAVGTPNVLAVSSTPLPLQHYRQSYEGEDAASTAHMGPYLNAQCMPSGVDGVQGSGVFQPDAFLGYAGYRGQNNFDQHPLHQNQLHPSSHHQDTTPRRTIPRLNFITDGEIDDLSMIPSSWNQSSHNSQSFPNGTDPWTPWSVGIPPGRQSDFGNIVIPRRSNRCNSTGVFSGDCCTGSNEEEKTTPQTSTDMSPDELLPRSTMTLKPQSPDDRASATSEFSSPSAVSNTLSSTSGTFSTLVCHEDDCGAEFTGTYRKGNLARHIRLKHGQSVRLYRCEAAGCRKVYNRQDARLKHYRRAHPERANGEAIRRR